MTTETLDLPAAEKKVRSAIKETHKIFLKHRKKLRDLSPRFWVALMDLELMADDASAGPPELMEALKTAYPRLGAPGDFGYGTPCGDGLRHLYDCWSKLAAAMKAAQAGAACANG